MAPRRSIGDPSRRNGQENTASAGSRQQVEGLAIRVLRRCGVGREGQVMWQFRSIRWVMVLLLGLQAVELRAGQPFERTVSTEVLGIPWAAPGDTVRFRVTMSGGTPGALVTIYEQLGSSLSFTGRPSPVEPDFERYCIISALPVGNLPGADAGAPAENRVACSVMTDELGVATLTLEAQVNREALTPTSDATTRDVAAIEDGSTEGVEAVAAAQIGLLVAPR
jgi:hypothetical protein